MKPRDRVLTALSREQPDRCPMQISFTPEFAARLRADMGLAGQNGHNPHGGGNTYELERTLGEDLLLTSVGWANCYYQSKEPYTDEWGIGWKSCDYTTPFGTGFYTEVVGHPLAEDNAIASYRPPDPTRPELYADAAHLIQNYKRDYFIVGVTVTTIFETAWALRGLERMLMDLVANPDLAKAILDIPYRYHLTAAKKLVEMGVDAIWVGDDIGAQHAMAKALVIEEWQVRNTTGTGLPMWSANALSPGLLRLSIGYTGSLESRLTQIEHAVWEVGLV